MQTMELLRYEYGHQTDLSFPTIMKPKILLLLVALPGAIRRIEGAVSTSLTRLHVRRNETTDKFILMTFPTQELPMNFTGNVKIKARYQQSLANDLRQSRALSYKCFEIDQRTFCDSSTFRGMSRLIVRYDTRSPDLRRLIFYAKDMKRILFAHNRSRNSNCYRQKLSQLCTTPRAPTAYGRA